MKNSFTTSRLLMRKPSVADSHDIYRNYAHDPLVTKYMIWKPHQTEQETKNFLEVCLKNWDNQSEYSFVITNKINGELMGMITARIGEGRTAEIGYVLRQSDWGHGYVPEAAKALIELLFTETPINKIKGTCDVDNKASARVMEKIGLTFDGVEPKAVLHPNISTEKRDVIVYSLDKNSFLKQTH